MEKSYDKMQDLDPKEKDQINHVEQPNDSPPELIEDSSINRHIESGDKIKEC